MKYRSARVRFATRGLAGRALARSRVLGAVLCGVLLLLPGCGGGGGAASNAADGGVEDGAAPADGSGADTEAFGPTSATLGPDGGTIALPGGGTLIVPPHVLEETVTVTATPVDPPSDAPFDAVGPFFEFAPVGLTFSTPVRLGIPIDPERVGRGVVSVAWGGDGGRWEALPAVVDTGANVVWTYISHFSRGGAAIWRAPEGACCTNGACTTAVAGDCPGTFFGGGVACGEGPRTVCDEVVCCGDGTWPVFAAGCGTALPLDDCEIVCCPGEYDDNFGYLVPRSQCPHPSPELPDACRPVCCVETTPDGATVRPSRLGRCDPSTVDPASGGSVSPDDDLTRCEVCCEDTATLVVTPFAECKAPAGNPHACTEVCCEGEEGPETLPLARCDGRRTLPVLACRCGEGPECRCEADADCDDTSDCSTDTCGADGQCVNVAISPAVCGDGCLNRAHEACEAKRDCEHPDDHCVDCACVPEKPCGESADCLAYAIDVGPCGVLDCVEGRCAVVPGPAGGACDDGDACTEADTCGADGACAGAPMDCSFVSSACAEGVCSNGGCVARAREEEGCGSNADCEASAICSPVDCRCVETCGNHTCDSDLGENDTICPEDCGCSALFAILPRGPCTLNQPDAGRDFAQPAPAGCWCDDACEWRPEGCCSDKAELCGPVCGDGFCSRFFGAETCATCPEDCADWGGCPDLTECGDGVCRRTGRDPESDVSCPEDCGCTAVASDDCTDAIAPFGCSCAGRPLSGGCIDACVACGMCSTCGDGLCHPGSNETRENCPADCRETACDARCDPGETALSCLASHDAAGRYECDAFTCGDGVCNESGGETAERCPYDCAHATVHW